MFVEDPSLVGRIKVVRFQGLVELLVFSPGEDAVLDANLDDVEYSHLNKAKETRQEINVCHHARILESCLGLAAAFL